MAFAATVSVVAVWPLILPFFRYVCTELMKALSCLIACLFCPARTEVSALFNLSVRLLEHFPIEG